MAEQHSLHFTIYTYHCACVFAFIQDNEEHMGSADEGISDDEEEDEDEDEEEDEDANDMDDCMDHYAMEEEPR